MKKKSPKEKQIPLVSLSSSSLLWFLIFPSQDKEHEVFSHCLQGPVWSRPSHNASLFFATRLCHYLCLWLHDEFSPALHL